MNSLSAIRGLVVLAEMRLFENWNFYFYVKSHTNIIPRAFGAVGPQKDMLLAGSSGHKGGGGATWWPFGHPHDAGCL